MSEEVERGFFAEGGIPEGVGGRAGRVCGGPPRRRRARGCRTSSWWREVYRRSGGSEADNLKYLAAGRGARGASLKAPGMWRIFKVADEFVPSHGTRREGTAGGGRRSGLMPTFSLLQRYFSPSAGRKLRVGVLHLYGDSVDEIRAVGGAGRGVAPPGSGGCGVLAAAAKSSTLRVSSKRMPRNARELKAGGGRRSGRLCRRAFRWSCSRASRTRIAQFAQDFGTLLDVEDLIPGAEYTLEVSSPGLERKLIRPEDYQPVRGEPGEAARRLRR